MAQRAKEKLKFMFAPISRTSDNRGLPYNHHRKGARDMGCIMLTTKRCSARQHQGRGRRTRRRRTRRGKRERQKGEASGLR